MPNDPFITEMDPVQKMWMFYEIKNTITRC